MPVGQQLLDGQLREEGFILQAALAVHEVAIDLPSIAGDYNQLLVFGHAGPGFWNRLDKPLEGDDPLDVVSIKLVESFLQRIGCTEYLVLYPLTVHQVDLRALGKQLGWHADSSLGIGINSHFGTWFAYRVVVLANTSYETSTNDPAESPCVSCIDSPCVQACPVGAPGPSFNLQTCMTERMRHGSACADQCLARNACPVGTAYRYERDQMRYHYQQSLQLIQSSDLA